MADAEDDYVNLIEPVVDEPAAVQPVPKRRRRWEDAKPEPAPAPAAPVTGVASLDPALLSMAPALGMVIGGPAPQAAPPVIDDAVAQAAQDAIRRMSGMLGGALQQQQRATGSLEPAAAFQLDIDINNSTRKGQLTKKQFQDEVTRETGAGIKIGGRYQPPGDTSSEERPLHLHIDAKSQESLDAAEAMIRDIMGPAPPSAEDAFGGAAPPLAPPPPPQLFIPGQPPPPPRVAAGAPAAPPPSSPSGHTCRLEVGVGPEAGYQVRGKLLGPKGSYLKHIQEQTGVRVQLSGAGSGNVTVAGAEADHPLSLSLSGATAEQLDVAKQLAEHLIAAVCEDWNRRNTPAPGTSSMPPPPSSLPQPPSAMPPAGAPPPYGVVPSGYPPRPANPYGFGYPPMHGEHALP